MGIFSGGGGGVWRSAEAKRCDHCSTAAAVVFCGAHRAFLCMPCDVSCHDNRLLRHERSWICDVCEQNPAAFTCRADAANLCPACDRDVHAANPLARRHHRVPAVPFYDTAESFLLRATSDDGGHVLVSGGGNDDLFAEMENCAVSALDDGYMGNVPMTAKITETDTKLSSLDHFLFSDIVDDDQFFEFDPTLRTYGDSIVPVQTSSIIPVQTSNNPHDHHLLKNQFESYNHNPSSASYCNSFNTQSLSVSSSTLDMGIVPERSMITSDSSNSFSKQSSLCDVGIVCSSIQAQHATTAKDVREAKVMRYREKRKNRKFEKTVRYASRKAYAESRPRIKGRFAKRSADYQSDLDFDDDEMRLWGYCC